jgi:hypothetical protein
MVKIVGISGSLRKASYNTALLRTALGMAPEGSSIEIFDLSPLPLYNDDLAQDNTPLSVIDFRNSITQSDGLLIASPEYNYSFTEKQPQSWVHPAQYSALHAANCTCGRRCSVWLPKLSTAQKFISDASRIYSMWMET